MGPIEGDREPEPIYGHGGARPGAGRKPKGYVRPTVIAAYEDSRARREAALAVIAEVEAQEAAALYVSAEAVRDAIGDAMQAIEGVVRPIPASIGKSLHLAPEARAELQRHVDAALLSLREDLARLC